MVTDLLDTVRKLDANTEIPVAMRRSQTDLWSMCACGGD